MTNKELELIGQLTEIAMIVAELKAENKILKDINEKLNQALRKTDVVGRSEQFLCPNCKSKTRMQNGFIWCENNDCGGIYRAK